MPGLADRLLTIAVTATVTSAAWIVAGSTWLVQQGGDTSGPDAETAAPLRNTPPPAPQPNGGGPLIIPVEGITPADLHDSFSDERGGGARIHQAIDIMAPAGTPVIAAAAGTIEKLFLSEEGGNTVYLRTGGGQMHYYAHLRSYAAGLSEGQQVASGQGLGTVGTSGNADQAAPHLHFAIFRLSADADWWDAGEALNPYPLLRHATAQPE